MTPTAVPAWWALTLALLALSGGAAAADPGPDAGGAGHPSISAAGPVAGAVNDSAVANFSSALQRLVTLVGVSGGALLALVWARVGISWFSNDVSKKVQAKDRARDALVGTLLFVAAVSGLIWALARWVITGG